MSFYITHDYTQFEQKGIASAKEVLTLVEVRADESSEDVVVLVLNQHDQLASISAAVVETA